jgi:hypothetical protein
MDGRADRLYAGSVPGETGAAPIVGWFGGGLSGMLALSVLRAGGDPVGAIVLTVVGAISIGVGRALR